METQAVAAPAAKSLPKPPKKKARRGRGHVAKGAPSNPSYLDDLPVEILAEILSYTTTRDILSLTRASKYFCHTLCNKSHDFVWKKARARFSPAAIPDPTPNFTEPAYAAVLFDYGLCEVNCLSRHCYPSVLLTAF